MGRFVFCMSNYHNYKQFPHGTRSTLFFLFLFYFSLFDSCALYLFVRRCHVFFLFARLADSIRAALRADTQKCCCAPTQVQSERGSTTLRMIDKQITQASQHQHQHGRLENIHTLRIRHVCHKTIANYLRRLRHAARPFSRLAFANAGFDQSINQSPSLKRKCLRKVTKQHAQQQHQ